MNAVWMALRPAWRAVRRMSFAGLILGLVAAAPGQPVRAAGPLDGPWLVKLDLNQSSLLYRAQVNLGLVWMTELWVVDDRYVRAFGRNIVFRIQGRSADGRELTAIEDWATSPDLEPRSAQNRPALVGSITMQLDAQRRVTITEAVGADRRVFIGSLVGAAPQAPATCPDGSAQQQQLTSAQRDRDQCRAELARVAQRSPQAVPAPAPAPIPAPAAAGCPAFAGGGSAIRIEGATDLGAGRVAVTLRRDDPALTLRGRSGFQRDLTRAVVGTRAAAIGSCGEFQVTIRPDPNALSLMLTAETADGRRSSLTIELRRE